MERFSSMNSITKNSFSLLAKAEKPRPAFYAKNCEDFKSSPTCHMAQQTKVVAEATQSSEIVASRAISLILSDS